MKSSVDFFEIFDLFCSEYIETATVDDSLACHETHQELISCVKRARVPFPS